MAPDADVQRDRHLRRNGPVAVGRVLRREDHYRGIDVWGDLLILLLAGGYLGGALTFAYGVRVLKRLKR